MKLITKELQRLGDYGVAEALLSMGYTQEADDMPFTLTPVSFDIFRKCYCLASAERFIGLAYM